ncbi:hypothetical protein PISMIDRAFT_19565 [Pisolithus microcarpus 441]|uniref:HNH nuclease domain-containing protein n=1 Tax=Pisolithus microcarpus 441 TaxID=765257 RepID=A0A0C9YBQ4_9AGAM|nr:hypothetical protein BKA83DRAFT_19565 [Pisolithus microcarpus]KIK11379.1 hypothetical protein PISMIDRAFT_19565 [Pisolithus microcarpus 441]
MPALPPVDTLPRWIRQHPRSHEIESAYNICLDLEDWIQHRADLGKEKEKALIHCRILGYLFLHFPSDNIGPFVREIVTISGKHQALLDLGERFYVYFVKLFTYKKGRTPMPSSHPSRLSVDDLVAKVEDELKDAPQNHQKAKKLALIRDGFQCVVTKVYDRRTMYDNRTLQQAVLDGADAKCTECAHIFPESISSEITPENYAATVWAVLDRFGYRNLRQDLNGARIHRLENVMTMEAGVRLDFDELRIYFTATEVPNRYKLEAFREICLCQRPRYVTFSTPDADKYPLPNPTYLAIHAACAKVAHHSGAAEHIEEVLKRMEDTLVLAEDGGSSDVLYTAMLSSIHTLAV